MNHLDISGSVVNLELGGVCSQPLFPGEKCQSSARQPDSNATAKDRALTAMAEGKWYCLFAGVRYLGMCHSREVEQAQTGREKRARQVRQERAGSTNKRQIHALAPGSVPDARA